MKLSLQPFSPLYLAIAFVCALGLVIVFVGVSTLGAAPETKFSKTLALGDKLVVKGSACALQIKSPSDLKFVIRCKTLNGMATANQSPRAKTVIHLVAGDRLIVKADACRLDPKTVTAAKIVIKCAALAQSTPTATATDAAPPMATETATASSTHTATATPTLSPTPTLTPTPTGTFDWLSYVNQYRDIANIPHVTENPTWSYGDYLHARYMVKNNVIEHTEDENNQWYTAEGKAAAENSDLIVSSSAFMSDESAIDGWMGAPFHALGIVDPALLETGYNSYHEADGGYQSGAGLDVLRGLGSVPGSVTYPVMFPGDGKSTALTVYSGNEFPNPLTSCAGYSSPTGLPILLQLGHWTITPNVTAHSFMQGASALEHCIFDETNYTNPDADQQDLVRDILNARDAIVLIPRAPLESGKTYTVSITTNGNTYTWNFSVANSAAPAPSEFAREIR